MTAQEQRQLISAVNAVLDEIRDGNRQSPRLSYAAVQELKSRQNGLLKQYYARLPLERMGVCPFCDVVLKQCFDRFSVEGFWWQEQLTGVRPEPNGCEHFRVLTGALNLNGNPPKGGRAEALVGPPTPYVIPAVLELPTMIAVVSALPMENGYTAFPIPYFSSDPPPSAALANPWTVSNCPFTMNGRASFTYKTDPWDFDLVRWVTQDKLRWVDGLGESGVLRSGPPSEFPLASVEGDHVQQTIVGDRVLTRPPPNNEVFDPFTD